MNGGQDLGGMQGFGPVEPEADEPFFHAPWEARVLALTLAMGTTGQWNIDQMRHARETLPPAQYLSSSYYQIWLAGLEKLMLDAGLVTESELTSGRSEHDPVSLKVLAAVDVPTVMGRGSPSERELTVKAAFAVGDPVVMGNIHPTGHTRLPRYIRGRRGTISEVRTPHVFPDSNARGDEDPQWLYSVRFDARELWGEDTTADAIFVDCWEPYLLPAQR